MEVKWLPKENVNSVIPIVQEVEIIDNQTIILNENIKVKHLGTAFFLEYNNLTLLVTCRHVVSESSDLRIIINLKGGIECLNIELMQKACQLQWIYHKKSEVDLALTFIFFPQHIKNIQHMVLPLNSLKKQKKDKLGEDIFFVGFPRGLGVEEKIIPIVRTGIVSAYPLDGRILIEGNAFKGSSGSPVWLTPHPVSMELKKEGGMRYTIGRENTKIPMITPLIGIISQGMLFIQNNQKENLGLVFITPIARLIEILESEEMNKQLEILKK